MDKNTNEKQNMGETSATEHQPEARKYGKPIQGVKRKLWQKV